MCLDFGCSVVLLPEQRGMHALCVSFMLFLFLLCFCIGCIYDVWTVGVMIPCGLCLISIFFNAFLHL